MRSINRLLYSPHPFDIDKRRLPDRSPFAKPGIKPDVVMYAEADEWQELKQLYDNKGGDILVTYKKRPKTDGNEWAELTFTCKPAVCDDCVTERIAIETDQALAYQSTTLRIELIPDELHAKGQGSSADAAAAASVRPQRARAAKKSGYLSVPAQSEGQLRDLKLRILQDYSHDLGHQRLYFDGRELTDDNKTLTDYKIPKEATLQLFVCH